MITSTRRVSPDKSEVRIAFSLDDTSGKRLHTHTCVPAPPTQTILTAYFESLTCSFNTRWSSSQAAFSSMCPPSPPSSHPITLTVFILLVPWLGTGAPSISVGAQHIKKGRPHMHGHSCGCAIGRPFFGPRH